MKRGSTNFLKGVIVLIGMMVLAICIFWLPEVASRDAEAHPDTAYLQYPFLGCAYAFCTPIFVALYQAFKLLSYIDENKAFSELSVRALRYIKYCANTISILVVAGILILIILAAGEDITGFITLTFICIFTSSVIATFAAVLQKLLQEALDIKSENELTV